MPIHEMPKYKAVPDKLLEIPQPAIGGLNLFDLEYEQELNQSPYLKNVMYRNGAFGKRFGQEVYSTYSDEIYSSIYFDGSLFVHSGTKIYKGENAVGTGFPESSGLFITFAQKLYYLISTGFYEYNGTTFTTVTHYVPDFIINCKPDGSAGGDVIDDLNVLGDFFKLSYNGEAGVTEYHVAEYDDFEGSGIIDWDTAPTIWADDTEITQDPNNPPAAGKFYVDKANKKIIFGTAPGEGDLNVVMQFKLKASVFATQKAQILGCKFYDTFGGANNSRLFLAGGGKSKYYWSGAYDVSYFPENNYATLGNTEDDITGFGRQYNVLIVFKPREVYSIYSYTETSSTTVVEENIGLESFRSQLVNASVGCDAPNSIQLVNNLLTWFNSKEGICTLVSTNVQDERNVRLISRNIDRTNTFGVEGILDLADDPSTVQSIDYNNKYFIVFPSEGLCFMWDYEIAPYRYSSTSGETNPKQLAWFLFDKFYVKQFLKVGKQLMYVSSYSDEDTNVDFTTSLIKLNGTFADLDYDGDGESDAIESYYMTPFLQFNVEMLKNIKNVYVQCRGDNNSLINMSYLTDDSSEPEQEPEPIMVGGHAVLWDNYSWGTFRWFMNVWGNTFRRKCNIKKVQMASILFENNELDYDMSITHIGMQYQLVKYIR